MDKKFKQIYYSDGGYWRGKSAIQRLAKASDSTKGEAERLPTETALVSDLPSCSKVHSKTKCKFVTLCKTKRYPSGRYSLFAS